MRDYIPRPIDTSKVALPESLKQLTEKLAENAHEIWASERIANGWSFGSTRDDSLKTNPCIVPYSDLPESEKEYDRQMVEKTLQAMIALGFTIEPERR